MSKLLSKPGRTEIGGARHFHDGNLVAAIDDLRDIDFLQIIRQAIVKRL